MPVEILKEKFTGTVQEVVLGATKEEGGTRAKTVKLGGSSTLPFLDAGRTPLTRSCQVLLSACSVPSSVTSQA
jgi:CO dehydrogenase/acetyl-CoA synthase delta subunit